MEFTLPIRRKDVYLIPVLSLILGIASCEFPLESGYQNPSDILSPAYVPVGPDGLSITMNSDSLFTIRWNDQSLGEDGFKLFRKSTADTVFSFLSTIGHDSTSYRDSQPKLADVVYTYRLYSYSGQKLSKTYSESRTVFSMNPPVIVSFQGSDSGRATLLWTSSIPFPTSCVIERSTLQGYDTLAISPAGMNAFTDATVDKFHIYHYRITSTTLHNTSQSAIAQCAYQIIGVSQTRLISTPITPVSGQQAVLSDDEMLFVSVGEVEAALVDFTSGMPIRIIRFPHVLDLVSGVALSRDKQTLAFSGWHDAAVYVYSVQDGRLLTTIHGDWPGTDVGLTDDGSLAIVSLGVGKIQCVRIADGTILWEKVLFPEPASVWMHPDGNRVLVGNQGGCQFLDIQSGTTLSSSMGDSFMKTPLVSPNGDVLILSSRTGNCYNVTQNRIEFIAWPFVGSSWISPDHLFVALAASNQSTRLLNALTGITVSLAENLWGSHNYTRMIDAGRQLIIHNQEGEIGVWNIHYSWTEILQ